MFRSSPEYIDSYYAASSRHLLRELTYARAGNLLR